MHCLLSVKHRHIIGERIKTRLFQTHRQQLENPHVSGPKAHQPGSHSGQWHPHLTQRGEADRTWFPISSQVMVMGGTDTPDKVLIIFPSSQRYFNCHEIYHWYKPTDLMTTWGHRAFYLNWRMSGTPEDWEGWKIGESMGLKLSDRGAWRELSRPWNCISFQIHMSVSLFFPLKMVT